MPNSLRFEDLHMEANKEGKGYMLLVPWRWWSKGYAFLERTEMWLSPQIFRGMRIHYIELIREMCAICIMEM